MSCSSDLCLKVDLDGDIRRFRIEQSTNFSETWEALDLALSSSYGFKAGSEVILKYRDDEGDLCTLANTTLQDCILQFNGKPIKLIASVKEPHDGTSHKFPQQQAEQNPPSLERAEERIQDAEGERSEARDPSGALSVRPKRILACLRSLREADKLSPEMVSSIMLHFLPMMAQMSDKLREKLNRAGARRRDSWLPLLHLILCQLDALEGMEHVKPMLEEFVSGKNPSKFGDCFAALVETLCFIEDKVAVAGVLKVVAEEFIDTLPSLLPKPKPWAVHLPTLPRHEGFSCASCGAKPIEGPRFHKRDADLDVCGECYIDVACDATSKFECHLWPTSTQRQHRWEAFRDAAWSGSEDWNLRWSCSKGKGKGKGKKGWWKDVCRRRSMHESFKHFAGEFGPLGHAGRGCCVSEQYAHIGDEAGRAGKELEAAVKGVGRGIEAAVKSVAEHLARDLGTYGNAAHRFSD
jgi:hypothetical protein